MVRVDVGLETVGGGGAMFMEVKITGGASVSYAVSTRLAAVAGEFKRHEQFVNRVLMGKVVDLKLIGLTLRCDCRRRSLQWRHIFVLDCKIEC